MFLARFRFGTWGWLGRKGARIEPPLSPSGASLTDFYPRCLAWFGFMKGAKCKALRYPSQAR